MRVRDFRKIVGQLPMPNSLAGVYVLKDGKRHQVKDIYTDEKGNIIILGYNTIKEKCRVVADKGESNGI